jgi:hypothetical protein
MPRSSSCDPWLPGPGPVLTHLPTRRALCAGKMAALQGQGRVSLLAATLRPETMYGQTNCWVLPEGQYGAYKGLGGEVYIMTERSALNLSYQVGCGGGGRCRRQCCCWRWAGACCLSGDMYTVAATPNGPLLALVQCCCADRCRWHHPLWLLLYPAALYGLLLTYTPLHAPPPPAGAHPPARPARVPAAAHGPGPHRHPRQVPPLPSRVRVRAAAAHHPHQQGHRWGAGTGAWRSGSGMQGWLRLRAMPPCRRLQPPDTKPYSRLESAAMCCAPTRRKPRLPSHTRAVPLAHPDLCTHLVQTLPNQYHPTHWRPGTPP